MGLTRDIIQAVKDRADIVQVIGERVTLVPAGANYKGLCPFHGEKTPSFHVNPSKGFYHCFGCGAGGSVIDFLMTFERLSFHDAVAGLASNLGITVTQGGTSLVRDRQMEVLEAARLYYHDLLLRSPEAEPARRYLTGRSFGEDSWEAFSLGFALDDWQGLIRYAEKRGFALEDLEACGLVKTSPSGRPYDLLRNRVIFPILGPRGACIAFGGRVLPGDDGPKYINTPETRFYRKSEVLFGLAPAREGLRTAGRALLVEGYLDVMRLHERGLREAVATCGTALTAGHLDLLEKHTERVYLVFDGDAAGVRAALRSAPLFLNRGMEARVVTLPEDQDPDDFLLRHGAEAFLEETGRAVPILEYLVFQTLRNHGDGVEGRERALRELVPILSEIRRPATRDITLRYLADLLMVKPEAIQAMLQSEGRHAMPAPDAPDEPSASPISRQGRHQRMLLKILLQKPDLIGLARDLLQPDDFWDKRLRRIYERITRLSDDEYASMDLEALVELLPEQAANLRALVMEAPLHARGVEDWEQVLRGEASRIRGDRKRLLLHRLKSAQHAGNASEGGAPEGDTPQSETPETLLQQLVALRHELDRGRPPRHTFGHPAVPKSAKPPTYN